MKSAIWVVGIFMLIIVFTVNGCKNDNTSLLDSIILDQDMDSSDGKIALSGHVYTIINNQMVPIMNASITVKSGIIYKEGITDSNGYFEVRTPLNEDRLYNLKIDALGFSTHYDTIELTAGKRNFDYILSSNIDNSLLDKGTIIGCVVDNNDVYIESSRVSIEIVVNNVVKSIIHPGDNGLFIGAITHECNIVVKAKGFKISSVVLPEEHKDTIYTNLKFKLSPDYLTTTLQILDYDTGDPINNAMIRIYCDGNSLGTFYSDAHGIATINELEDKSYTVLVSLGGYYEKSVGLDPGNESIKIIRLEAFRAVLSGRVIDSSTGRGLEGVSIYLENGNQTVSNVGGDYNLENIPPRVVNIYFQKAGFEMISYRLDFSPNEEKSLDISMYNNIPNSSISCILYREVNGEYSFLNLRDTNSLSIELFKKRSPDDTSFDNLKVIDITNNITFDDQSGFKISPLNSGIYMLRINYLETQGSTNQPNGLYSNNDDIEFIVVDEGINVNKPIILKYVMDSNTNTEDVMDSNTNTEDVMDSNTNTGG